jgi:hypothetical protein
MKMGLTLRINVKYGEARPVEYSKAALQEAGFNRARRVERRSGSEKEVDFPEQAD